MPSSLSALVRHAVGALHPDPPRRRRPPPRSATAPPRSATPPPLKTSASDPSCCRHPGPPPPVRRAAVTPIRRPQSVIRAFFFKTSLSRMLEHIFWFGMAPSYKFSNQTL
ncbi:hypothetical protein GQ55_3G317900 [Panicum hallii var. hallii]|uniref:Uncharacterized protein n=1 Tax=Panicum hallii var. hallii TaxID=1504633 RepID=A0A2T7EFC0_9POAL|nr:hypothetical protein GQ55_3G317900 [Panicum hallii var. hallii]